MMTKLKIAVRLFTVRVSCLYAWKNNLLKLETLKYHKNYELW